MTCFVFITAQPEVMTYFTNKRYNILIAV